VKLRLEATPEELRERGSELLDAMAKALGEDAPALADRLQKAATAPAHEPVLKHQALRDLHTKMRARAQRGFDRMITEIVQTVDGHMVKSATASPDYTAKMVDEEQAAYDKMQAALIGQGYTPEDFEEGGPLYGMSVNELRDLFTESTKKADSK